MLFLKKEHISITGRTVTAKIEYCIKSIFRTCVYIKLILHEIMLPCKIDFMQKIWCARHIFDILLIFEFT
jgi:hypothetical protein